MGELTSKEIEIIKALKTRSPGQVAQLVGASARTPKGYGFGPWSGHTPKLQSLGLRAWD